jgi:hypothetical protein
LGLWIHLGVSVFWPLASGFAQVPTILAERPYRSGFISVFYVMGIIGIGILLFLITLATLRKAK